MAPSRRAAPDQPERDAAIVERRRNVLIDAGAGTGKTTILVDRLVEMLAPTTGAPAVPIDRMAAITFTRKAAGELRLRIRERLLGELAADASSERGDRLRDALAGLDTAYVGTIHSFADRLLRLRPVEARLSPSYEIAEDAEALVRETFEVLLHAVQSGTLAAELTGDPAAARADEATRTVLFALDVGVLAESRETEHNTQHGVDGLVRGFIAERDIPPPDIPAAAFDHAAFEDAADQLIRATRTLTGDSQGVTWLRRLASALRSVKAASDPVVALKAVRRALDRTPPKPTKRDTFAGDGAAWTVWNRFARGDDRDPTPLRQRICSPLDRWLATRLARLFPVVVALHETVKARHAALDQIDLLLKLRDLLVDHPAVRREFQRLFDHVFVDEFQDTDPLQAEIVLFLCEQDAVARRWDEVALRPGSLTLVGDPKQSIYRFRRADIGMYDHVRRIVARDACLRVTLSANFRSTPRLIAWLNDRFERILGVSPDQQPFDAATGRVFHRALLPGRQTDARAAVHVLPFDFADGKKHKVDEYRELEGEALSRYLRWLVERSDVSIEDPLTGRPRRVRYGDIGVLAVTTWRLSLLFPWLDAEDIPYASRGGTLFLSDPPHRQFLLGLRAVADRDDGVAEAALMRPPFFALDPADLVKEQEADDGASADDGVRRVREARALIRELRRHRFDRSPGVTARELLDRTAFARALALGPNGAQRLARVRELCLLLEHTAVANGLDYDAVTARLREWVTDPVQVDPPHPVGTEAVHVLTVHQAKGLEFPVVVLWDGKGRWDARLDTGPWKMERDGRGWLMGLHALAWEEPPGLGLRDTEQSYLNAERRRLAYVAATRARELLVIPRAGTPDAGKMICADLLHDHEPSLVRELEPYRAGHGAGWAREPGPLSHTAVADSAALEESVSARWSAAALDAARPRFSAASVSGVAAGTRDDDAEADGTPPARVRQGRFGSAFGSAVHHAVGLLLRGPAVGIQAAVAAAARRHGLTAQHEEAIADVSRALDALKAEGIEGPVGPALRVEYPVAGPWSGGRLLSGFIDLVAVTGDRVVVIDFKTDVPPGQAIEDAYAKYASQVAIYGALLRDAGVVGERELRCGLLFTADGIIRWAETTTLVNREREHR